MNAALQGKHLTMYCRPFAMAERHIRYSPHSSSLHETNSPFYRLPEVLREFMQSCGESKSHESPRSFLRMHVGKFVDETRKKLLSFFRSCAVSLGSRDIHLEAYERARQGAKDAV